MSYMEKYGAWLENEYFDEETRQELELIKDNQQEIEERFYRELEFGTGGLRGIIGAGTNRINKYIVRKASQGLSNYVNKQFPHQNVKSIVIAYDSRYKSDEFALESAKVFAANGIRAYLFDSLRPTPELSFAVRYLRCQAGIVITASHNPKEYNGYKVYGDDGGQLPPELSNKVLDEVNSISDITDVNVLKEDIARQKELIVTIGDKIDNAYYSEVKKLCLQPELIQEVQSKCKIIYTPLHGSGNIPVRRILKDVGFENIMVVKEQEKPDSDFPTVQYPNPEDKAAFKIAIGLAKEENVDLIIATDPDADRVGVVVKNNKEEYITLTGNQTGCLLMEYILSTMKSKGKLPQNGFIVKTIVTTELTRKIAREYNIELIEVLTGFKFIGEKIKMLDEMGDMKYLFGFEESYGYLAGTFARDKDAVVASMLIAEMYAWYKSRNMTIYDGLNEIYEKYGYSLEELDSFTLKGKEGVEKIHTAMKDLRHQKADAFTNIRIAAIRDYEESIRIVTNSDEKYDIDLPKSDVLYYEVEDGSWFCVRPSGTEPKIKIYYGVSDKNMQGSIDKLDKLRGNVLNGIKPLLNYNT